MRIKAVPDMDPLKVLILVVMEYTQWAETAKRNPIHPSLNPCCNGIYSMSDKDRKRQMFAHVLILVVMEYTQWGLLTKLQKLGQWCLNPCCNGIYSMRNNSCLMDKRIMS